MAGRGHILDANTLALWRCDEVDPTVMLDSGPNSWSLTHTSGSAPAVIEGRIGLGRYITTATTRLSRSVASTTALYTALTTGPYAWEAWVNLDGVAAASTATMFVVNGASVFVVQITASRTLTTNIGSVAATSASGAIPANGWTHCAIAVAYDAGTPTQRTVQFYVNGVASGSPTTITPTFGAIANSVALGNTSAARICGYDDIRVSNVARNAAEIQESYRRGAPFLMLNGFELPVRHDSATTEVQEVGESVRAFDGTLRKNRQAEKRRLTFDTPWLLAAEAEAWLNFIRGIGWHWPLNSHLYSDNGRGPSSVTGSVTVAAIATLAAGIGGGFAMRMPNGTSIVFTLPIGSVWTVGVWRHNGTSWEHWIIRSDGAKWQAGVRNDALATSSFIAVTSTTLTISNASGTQYHFDELTVLPYLIPDAWAAPWASSQVAFSPLPNLSATGDLVPNYAATMRGTVTDVKYGAGVLTSAFETNLQSLNVQLDEV